MSALIVIEKYINCRQSGWQPRKLSDTRRTARYELLGAMPARPRESRWQSRRTAPMDNASGRKQRQETKHANGLERDLPVKETKPSHGRNEHAQQNNALKSSSRSAGWQRRRLSDDLPP